MVVSLLRTHLEPVAGRQRRWKLWRGLAICWAGAALAGLGFILFQRLTGLGMGPALPLLAVAAAVAAILAWRRCKKWEPDFRQIARQIERHHPELHSLLLTAVEQQPDSATGTLNYLQDRVVRGRR